MSEKNNDQNNEIRELLRQIEEYKRVIQDAEDALDAAVENLEEALDEQYGISIKE